MLTHALENRDNKLSLLIKMGDFLFLKQMAKAHMEYFETLNMLWRRFKLKI